MSEPKEIDVKHHWHGEYTDEISPEMRELKQERDEIKKKYYELIMVVATKHPNESRHQTALRYITQQEKGNQSDSGCVSTKSKQP